MASAAQAGLLRQQEELDRKAAELDRKERELQNTVASLHGKRAAGPWPPCLAQKKGASLGTARRQREREAGMRSSCPHPRQSLAPAPATALLLMCLQPSLAREGLPSPLISSAPVLSPSHHQPHTQPSQQGLWYAQQALAHGAHTLLPWAKNVSLSP